ncbi:luciferin 4-monooxygenase-like [Spodoptera litura]|uniref:Luciferin 4-monooxygenase-like n=1 Tax=Spodoptera litura TaxID=69820 RepID=A0A9J7J2D3_SPOLT|nr:luciferin 4-monooxygenase-like [Spodoptera litura]
MATRAYNAVQWYMEEVGARVVAKTGIPSDRHHVGKLMLQSLQEDPDFILQINGATGESETFGSALDRSIRCAVSLTNMGLKKGDVMVLMGPNHLDFCIPHNAAFYLGIMVASIDATLGVNELRDLFHNNKPNIIFGQSEKMKDIERALTLSEVDAKVITFDKDGSHISLAQLLEVKDKEAIKNFKPTDFDPEHTVGYLTSTSGTTGVPKTAMLTHKNLSIGMPYIWANFTNFPTPTNLVFMASPAQWLSAGIHYVFSSVFKYTRLQSSSPITPEHFAELVNAYKPSYFATSPNMMVTMMANAKCDFTCFEYVGLGGSAVTEDVIDEVKKKAQTDEVYILYGMSEASGITVQHDMYSVPGSYGRPIYGIQTKLVDPNTNDVITEPNVPGEVWFKGPSVFKGYYNNPEVTKEAITEDGWLKSGDIFYRDQHWNLFFVERYKLLLKYRNHQVSPVEIETVIMKHPGVLHAAVTGIPDRECGDLVVACVVPKPGCSPTAQEIKDLVKESLTDSKQLRGGVIFLKELPTTSTSKINRQKLKELVLSLPRQ